MIKLTVTSYPEKGMDLEAVAGEGVFLVEVVRHLPFGLRVRDPLHPLEGEYDREAFVDLLLDADNGEASELLAALGIDSDAAWARYHRRRVAEPRSQPVAFEVVRGGGWR